MQNEYTDGWIKIIDNFVPQTTFDRLNENILSAGFPWYWTDTDYNTEGSEIKQLIKNFNDQEGGVGVITDSYGRELRAEVNSTMIIVGNSLQYNEQ